MIIINFASIKNLSIMVTLKKDITINSLSYCRDNNDKNIDQDTILYLMNYTVENFILIRVFYGILYMKWGK